MQKALLLRRTFHRFFPRKPASSETKSWDHLTEEEKKVLALQALSQGELSLLQGDLSALSLFETASQLDPQNPLLWMRQGIAFFEYGSQKGKEKKLLLASKQLKIALQLQPALFEGWVAWGCVLLQLAKFHEEQHFYLEAKEKYEKAIQLIKDQDPLILGELYWDYAVVCKSIGQCSGEALDLHLAIQIFQKALSYIPNPPAELYNDCGYAYLELGLLINDQHHLSKATEAFRQAISQTPHFFEGWLSLAETYGQMYLNSMDERFVTKASECFAKMVELDPNHIDGWLGWGQLLAETGRLNKNAKPLFTSIEKCLKAQALEPENTSVISQLVESLSSFGLLANKLEPLMEAKEKIAKASEASPHDPDLWHAYGVCLMAFAQYFEDEEYDYLAIEKLQYGLSLDRTNAEIWHALGVAHKHASDLTNEELMIERSARFLAKAMDLKPLCPSLTFDTAAAFLAYSETFDDLSSLEYAISLFESLISQHRNALLHHPEWLFEYACALDWLADYTGYEKDFLRAIEVLSHLLLIDPDYPKAHLKIGMNYVQTAHLSGDIEQYKRAIQAFRLAARQEEENSSVWLEWGLCLMHLGFEMIDKEFVDQIYLDAEEKLMRAGRLGHPGARYGMARLYSSLERTTEAMRFIEESFAMRTLPPIEELFEDEWLEPLRKTPSFTSFITELEAKLEAREQ